MTPEEEEMHMKTDQKLCILAEDSVSIMANMPSEDIGNLQIEDLSDDEDWFDCEEDITELKTPKIEIKSENKEMSKSYKITPHTTYEIPTGRVKYEDKNSIKTLRLKL